MMHGFGRGYGMMGSSWGGGILMMGLFLLVVVGAIYFSRNSQQLLARSRNKAAQDPIKIAERRYARGEITKGELKNIRAEL